MSDLEDYLTPESTRANRLQPPTTDDWKPGRAVMSTTGHFYWKAGFGPNITLHELDGLWSSEDTDWYSPEVEEALGVLAHLANEVGDEDRLKVDAVRLMLNERYDP